MTQLEILKYAYIGALETAESMKKAKIGSEESRELRREKADRDFKEIRDMMFAEIEKGTDNDRRQNMTLEELEALPAEILSCAQVAPILKADPYTIHLTAMQRPQLLGFPVNIMGRRVRIPKGPFIQFIRGDAANN